MGRLLNRKQAKPEQPKEEAPTVELPIEEIEVIEEVVVPVKPFEPYFFKPVLFLEQTEDSKVFEIDVLPEEFDQTDYIQAQLDVIPDGSLFAPTIIRFPEGRWWTEGNSDNIGIGKDNAILLFKNKKFFIVEGGSFYTKAPFSKYGGNISKNDYSHRRHIKFSGCEDFKVRRISVEGSNVIDGRLIGTTPELTPSFWKGGNDDGSFGGAPAYKSYWEFEHAFDFASCKRFIVQDVKANGVWGDGICLGVGNEDFEIKDAYLRFVGRQGVAIYDSRRGLLDGVIVDLGRRAAIDKEPFHDAGYADEIEIKNCKLHAIQVPFAALGLGTVNDINIHDNEYSGGSSIICGDSARRTMRKNWVFKNNVRTNVFGSPSADIKFHMTDNVLIEGNTIQLAKTQGQRIAQFEDCKRVEFLENNFTNAKEIVTRNSEVKTDNKEIEIKEY